MRTSGKLSENSILENKWSLWAVLSCFGMMLLMACTPLGTLLGLVALPISGWLVILGGCVVTFIASEIFKNKNL